MYNEIAEIRRSLERLEADCAARQAALDGLQADCEQRQHALEHMIDLLLDAANDVVEARRLIEVSAAAGAPVQAIETTLESPQLKNFRRLALAV